MLNNEEDVKNKLVVPYLKSLGFDESELFYENSFSLNVGRYTYRVDTQKQVSAAQPRLDILIKQRGKNLCIVEVKDTTVNIGFKEIDQAVSYGRLVHPIAPICIITNGKDWKMVDTITKEELSKDKLFTTFNYAVSLPQEAYYEALYHFLGYSQENVLTFCRWQVDSYIEPLRGSRDDRDKKYIEAFYEPRKHAATLLETFTQSTSNCFVIIADSGNGKSCLICHSALQYLAQGYATFFYRGVDVEEGIFKAMSEDLNWSFSPQYDEIQGIKRLLDIFRQEMVLIFVDGLDEMPLRTARKILTHFIRRTEGTKVKLITTCKSDIWGKLLEEDETPTYLAGKIFQVESEKGYRLEKFDEQEFFFMLEKYRTFYQYYGPFDSEVYEACKQNPFLLRVMFEVAADQRWSYITYEAADFYQAYFRKLSNRFEQKDVIQRLLTCIAKSLYIHNADAVDIDIIAEDLGLSPTESIPERLFELNVLERVERDNSTSIGFYFKKLRDYLIAFRALKWQNLAPRDFLQEVEKLEISGVCLDALNLYYSLASDEHKRILDSPLYENARRYVQFYEETLDNNFHAFKSAFPPHTAGRIGFVGHLNLSRRAIFYYGFRPTKGTDKPVLFFPKAGPDIGNVAHLHGSLLQTWRGGSSGFRSLNVAEEVLWEEIRPSLDKIIEHGMLNESQNKDLLMERVFATCVTHYTDYFQQYHKNGGHSYLPLRLETLREYVLYKIAHNVLFLQCADRKLASGTLQETWNGSIRSVSITLEPGELAEIDVQAWAMARQGKNMALERKQLRVEAQALSLLQDIDSLAKLNIFEITRSPLTDWYDENKSGIPRDWDEQRFIKLDQLLESLYLSFLNEYQILVESNFPTMCQDFNYYQRLPMRLAVALEREDFEYDPTFNPLCMLGILLQESRKNIDGSNVVALSSPEQIKEEALKRRADPTYRGPLQSSSGADSILRPHHSFTPYEVDSSICILRNLVYKRIKEDLKAAFDAFSSKQGVSR